MLNQKTCVPCQGNIPPLDAPSIQRLLEELSHGWQLNAAQHLCKSFTFSNFLEAMTFANKITQVAEKEQHHPNLTISWGECSVEIWTHKIQGLTESDFILAAKIEELIHG